MGTVEDRPARSDAPRTSRATTSPRRGRARRRRRARLRLVVVVALAVIAIGLWAASDLRPAYQELRAAETAAARAQTALLAGDLEDADAAFATAQERFLAADRHLATGGVRLLGSLPVAGRNLAAVDALTDAGGLVASAGRGVTSAILQLPGGTASLAPQEGRLPVDAIAALAPALEAAAAQVDAADRRVAEAPSRLLAPPVASARQTFAGRLAAVREPVTAGRALAAVLPAYLGRDEPRRYFFGAQNPAEARGTGGLIGAWTVLTVDRGALRFGEFETISTLTLPRDEVYGVAPPTEEYGRRYGRFAAAGHGSNINMTPDFPTAAQAILNLHERRRGEALDGAIVADPFVFEALLRLTGGVDVPDVRSLDAESVVRFLTNEQWAEFPEDGSRKPVLGEVAQSTLQRFLGDGGDPARALQVLGETAAGGHLLLHSASADEQRAFVEAGVAGAFPPGPTRPAADGSGSVFAVIANNAAANKLDYYLERSIDYEVWLDGSGDAFIRATIDLRNTAPTSGSTTTVLGPNVDDLQAGDHRLYLSVYCGPGCELARFSRDGRPAPTGSERELGLAVHPTTIELAAGQATQLTYEWRQRDAWDGEEYEVVVPGQALVRPADIAIRVHPALDSSLRALGDGAVVRSDGVVSWDGTLGRRAVLTVERVGS